MARVWLVETGKVRPTEDHANTYVGRARKSRLAAGVALCVLLGAALLGVSGCSGAAKSTGTSTSTASTEATGQHMAGPSVDVHVSQAAIDAQPAHWVLTTPQSAVRSYLDWTSYVYRIGQTDFAQSVMGAKEFVRVDAYNQYNLEQKRLIDQKLDSITFGTPKSTNSTTTLLPAQEKWTYSYLSITKGNPVSGGPYPASYDSTYTVVKNAKGEWLVDSEKVTPKGTVK